MKFHLFPFEIQSYCLYCDAHGFSVSRSAWSFSSAIVCKKLNGVAVFSFFWLFRRKNVLCRLSYRSAGRSCQLDFFGIRFRVSYGFCGCVLWFGSNEKHHRFGVSVCRESQSNWTISLLDRFFGGLSSDSVVYQTALTVTECVLLDFPVVFFTVLICCL